MHDPIPLSRFRHPWRILFVLGLIPAVLLIDSGFVAQRFAFGQSLANLIMLAAFLGLALTASGRLRHIMLIGVFIALAGEVLFSLVLGMYEYRLENVPIYVPPGHSVVYACVYFFVREPWARQHHKAIERALLAVAIAYGLFWLACDHDVYGLLCLAVLLALYQRHPGSRLFLMSMFLVVAYLEQLGTRLDCWYWPSVAFDRVDWLPSGNPPSAISIFYFAFDVLCVKVYLRLKQPVRSRLKRTQAAVASA